MKTPAKVLKPYYLYDRGMGKYLVEEARLLKVQSYRNGADTHCRKKIGDLLIVSQQILIICSSLDIKIAQFVEH